MNPIKSDFERSMLRIGSIAFIAGLVITVVSTLFHASSHDLTDHPVVFAIYAQSNTWIAAHIGQFAGVMLIFAGGFVALFRLLVQSESGTTSALAWVGFALTIMSASTFAILQAVDGIALKRAVDSWYAIPSPAISSSSYSSSFLSEDKVIAFRAAEGIRWVEIGINSFSRIIQGAVALLFGAAIAKSITILSRWIGVFGIVAGAATIIAGVGVAYLGFAPLPVVGDFATFISFAWVIVLAVFLWRKSMVKKIVSR